ncbi:MAG: murein biosynthesis integral membrane protein MurJ [Patescibacteria group bacterium]
MVRTIFNFFYKETNRLHQAAFLLAFFSILSQILAFLRDRLLAHFFGAGTNLDIYYAAFRIPDFLFVAVASIVSLSVLVPFIIEKESGGKEEVKKFLDDIFSFFAYLIFFVSVLAFFLIPKLSPILFKGFSGEALEQVILLSRIFLLSPIFLGVSNLLGSMTQAYNRFLIYAFAPVLYNAGIILGIVGLSSRLGIIGVAIGVVLGSLLHMAIQLPYVFRLGLFPRFKPLFDFSSIRRVVSLSFPRTLTLSMNHVATLFLVSLASLMTAGSISIYSFAFNISSVPLVVIGVSYSLAAFPTLSRHFSSNNIGAFVEQMSLTVRHIIFWSLPVMALFIVVRAQIVRVLLGTGRFDWNDTRLTAAALALFSVSVLAQSLILLFVRAFYSAGHTKKPLIINTLSAGLLMLLTYGAVKLYYAWPTFAYFIGALLKVDNLPGTVVLMLPLGYSLGTIVNAVIHWREFEKDFGKFSSDTYHTLLVSSAASVFVGLGSYVGLNIFARVFNLEKLWGIFLQGFLAGILGILTGILVLWLLKSRELKEFWEAIHQKFSGVKAIAENPEIV